MKAAIYARVSTADGRQDAENQLTQLRQFAATQGWKIAVEYIDHESGGKADRAEFKKLFVGASQRRFDVVLVWALDRFTREGVAETFQHIKRLTSHSVQFVSYTEEHFRTTGAAGELMIAVPLGLPSRSVSEYLNGCEQGWAEPGCMGPAVAKPWADHE